MNEALRPADATADWPSRIADLIADDSARIARGFDGLALIEAPSEEAEARAVAAAVRHALEDPGAQVAVVTPDPDVGARIAVALGRWGVEADVSAGSRLAATASGGLCALALDAAVEPGEPVALCALLKHPLAHLGRARGPRRDAVGALEARLLRGPRRDSAFDALLARAADEERLGAEALALAEDVAAALAPLLMDGEAPASAWARAHASAVEALNAPAEGVGEADTAPVWADAAGEAASDLLRALIDHGDALGPLDVRAYARVFSALAADAVVRAPARAGARVRVLGPIEARLQGADVVILAGLNEGTWPAPVSQDPFLNRVMRQAAGLPPAERRLGASAHDFAQFACAPQVLLTRAARVDGQPTVASRWVWRLRTLARGAGLDEALNPPVDYLAIAEAADRRDAAPAARAVRPAARPPANARSRVMSVSSVRLWMEDPYALYAKLVLGLRPWDPLGGPLDARDAGHAIHEACARDLAGETADASTLAQTMRALYAAKGAAPDDLAREGPRFVRAAAWLAEWHGARLKAGWRVALIEREGKVASAAPDFTVTARADRIDAHADDGLAVIDYKRGAVPGNAEVIAAKDPQLALEAVIAAAGGFAGLAAGVPTAWLHIAASGRDPAGAEQAAAPPKPSKTNPDPPTSLPEAAQRAWAGVLEAATRYADPATPYAPPWRTIAPKAPGVVEGDYDRLSRRREWASAEGEG